MKPAKRQVNTLAERTFRSYQYIYRQGQYSLELRGVVSIVAPENNLLPETQERRFLHQVKKITNLDKWLPKGENFTKK